MIVIAFDMRMNIGILALLMYGLAGSTGSISLGMYVFVVGVNVATH